MRRNGSRHSKGMMNGNGASFEGHEIWERVTYFGLELSLASANLVVLLGTLSPTRSVARIGPMA
jgi:hypothetical protein